MMFLKNIIAMYCANPEMIPGKPQTNPNAISNQSYQHRSTKNSDKPGTFKKCHSPLGEPAVTPLSCLSIPHFGERPDVSSRLNCDRQKHQPSHPHSLATVKCDRALGWNARGSNLSVTSKNGRPPRRTHFSPRACFHPKTAAHCTVAGLGHQRLSN